MKPMVALILLEIVKVVRRMKSHLREHSFRESNWRLWYSTNSHLIPDFCSTPQNMNVAAVFLKMAYFEMAVDIFFKKSWFFEPNIFFYCWIVHSQCLHSHRSYKVRWCWVYRVLLEMCVSISSRICFFKNGPNKNSKIQRLKTSLEITLLLWDNKNFIPDK